MNTNTIINLDSIIARLEDEIKSLKVLSRKIVLPKYTEAQRDNLNAVEGLMIYNTTSGKVQTYISATWIDLN